MTKAPRHAPSLMRLRVEGVRLYQESGRLDVDLTSPISAFVGANGIGKSTLLALTNFAITGLVPNPTSGFMSVDEFAEKTASFSARYFAGRVDESFRDAAEVSVVFRLGGMVFEVTRGLFEGRLIRSFRSTSGSDFPKSSRADQGEAQSDLALAYQDEIVAASGLANFDQFTFWQLFLMTFDERRHLLFWDDKTLQSALMISLGRSPHDALEAEALQRNIERQDSLARNSRWQATQATNKRRRLQKASSPPQLTDEEYVDLKSRFESLVLATNDANDRMEAKEIELRDTSRTVAEIAIAESALEQAYLEVFSTKRGRSDVPHHPIFRNVLNGGSCDVCGTHTHNLSPRVAELLEASKCPICESAFGPVDVASRPDELLRLDEQLADARMRLADARSAYHRHRGEAATASENWERAVNELEAFQSANEDIAKPRAGDDNHEQILHLDAEIASAMKNTEEYRQQRDFFRQRLEPIIAGLASGYEQIETIFVPNFRKLAEQFIGRTVDVEFERRGVSIGLRFSLDGQSRRDPSELSESQQYFLDIALRMSLIETFLPQECTLLVDTPEGSLDIAYETRAGLLFDRFARSNYSIFMLSNLNASNLLSELATLSSPERMTIFKMIDWSRLSEVQLESVALFDREYERLESALASTNSNA